MLESLKLILDEISLALEVLERVESRDCGVESVKRCSTLSPVGVGSDTQRPHHRYISMRVSRYLTTAFSCSSERLEEMVGRRKWWDDWEIKKKTHVALARDSLKASQVSSINVIDF
jgi:hypothetical protein